MIRAYDDNGNVVDLVEWEKQIKSEVIDECIKTLNEKYYYHAHDKDYPEYDDYCVAIADCMDELEQLKEQK